MSDSNLPEIIPQQIFKEKKKGHPPANGFKPGQSGNPSGRPKMTQQEMDLIAACKAKAPEALETILRIMRDGSEKNQLSAAFGLLERGFGKAVQNMEHSGKDGKPIETAVTITFVSPSKK